jgi:hypothetical protein
MPKGTNRQLPVNWTPATLYVEGCAVVHAFYATGCVRVQSIYSQKPAQTTKCLTLNLDKLDFF